MIYHNLEEGVIALISFFIGAKAFIIYMRRRDLTQERENNGRIFFAAAGFTVLAINSAIHASIHVLGLNENLLFQTLFGYSLGLLILILSVSLNDPEEKKYLLLFSLPLLIMFLPGVYEGFPNFGIFRPLIWIIIAYLSGTLCIMHIAMFQNTGIKTYLYSAFSFSLITISGIFLFSPSAIGSTPWIHGHLMRPIGFVILLFTMKRATLVQLKGSILYRALTVFTLLAGLPLLFFGIAIFYQEMHPVDVAGRRFLIFLLLLVTLVVALIFGIGVVSRLIKPILVLKKGVDSLALKGFDRRIEIHSRDEIEELAKSFNTMTSALDKSLKEQVRLTRLAATGELAATLAHEIRNPLNAIGGAAAYINRNFKGSLISEFLTIIREEVSRINRLTTSLLNFSKPMTPQLAMADINAIVDETVSLVKREYEDKGVSLESSLTTGIPLMAVDHNQMKQVLINLLINALDASAKGKIVEVSTEMAGGQLRMSVRDSGKGMTAEKMKNIFNPFYTTKATGTGLGLSIAERIVREHNGEITVESSEGRGSIFSVLLPIGKL